MKKKLLTSVHLSFGGGSWSRGMELNKILKPALFIWILMLCVASTAFSSSIEVQSIKKPQPISTGAPHASLISQQDSITFSPNQGAPGFTRVSILGQQLLDAGRVPIIFFDTTRVGLVYLANNSRIDVEVPIGARTGTIRLLYANGSRESHTQFVVVPQSQAFCASGGTHSSITRAITSIPATDTLAQGSTTVFKFWPISVGDILNLNICSNTDSIEVVLFQKGSLSSITGIPRGVCDSAASSTFFQAVNSDTLYASISRRSCLPLRQPIEVTYKKTPEPQLNVLNRTIGVAGELTSIIGRNLELVQSILIGGAQATIIARTDSFITIIIPVLPIGNARLFYSYLGNFYPSALNLTICGNINRRINSTSGNNLVCSNGNLELIAPLANSYVWNTGSRTRRITVSRPGLYWVDVVSTDCRYRADTFLVELRQATPVSLVQRNDTLFALPRFLTFIWLRDGQRIGSYQNDFLVPTISGTYSVIGTENGCRDTATLVVTNLENSIAAQTWNLYPNPASQVVNIDAEQPMTLGVYAITGTLVQQAELNQGTNAVPINMLAPGIYYLTDGRVRKRLVVW